MENLSPAVQQKLARGDIETESAAVVDGRRDARAYALVGASPERVWEVITDYERYKDFMPFTTVSEVRRREADTVWFHTELSFPLKKIWYEIKLELEKPSWRVSWTLVDGNLKHNEGSWQLAPYGEGETYLVYTVYIAPGFPIPGYILSRLTRGSLPDLIRVVRKRAGDTKYK